MFKFPYNPMKIYWIRHLPLWQKKFNFRKKCSEIENESASKYIMKNEKMSGSLKNQL